MSKSQRAKLKQLKQGKTVYYVNALGENSFISKYLLMSRPYMNKNVNSLFINAIWMVRGNQHACHFSLKDCNVVTNEYNEHHLFTTLKAAQRYLAYCKTQVGFVPRCLWDWNDDPLSYDDYWDEA